MPRLASLHPLADSITIKNSVKIKDSRPSRFALALVPAAPSIKFARHARRSSIKRSSCSPAPLGFYHSLINKKYFLLIYSTQKCCSMQLKRLPGSKILSICDARVCECLEVYKIYDQFQLDNIVSWHSLEDISLHSQFLFERSTRVLVVLQENLLMQNEILVDSSRFHNNFSSRYHSPHSKSPSSRSRCAHAVSTLSVSQSDCPPGPRPSRSRWSCRQSNSHQSSCCIAATLCSPRWADRATPRRWCCRICLMDAHGFRCEKDICEEHPLRLIINLASLAGERLTSWLPSADWK